MTGIEPASFARLLVGDVVTAEARQKVDDTPTHRREVIRAIFSAIEGLQWQLKEAILQQEPELTFFERAAMLEQTYSVSDSGEVYTQPRFLALPTSIRLMVRVVKRFRPDYSVDFNHSGWSNLRASIEVRNRLTHPKRMEDLEVSDAELSNALSATYWVLALVIEVMRETYEHVKEHRDALRGIWEEIKNLPEEEKAKYRAQFLR